MSDTDIDGLLYMAASWQFVHSTLVEFIKQQLIFFNEIVNGNYHDAIILRMVFLSFVQQIADVLCEVDFLKWNDIWLAKINIV